MDASIEGDWIDVSAPYGVTTREINVVDLDEAAARWSRGERKEALHWLELALGREFDGLGDLTPEQLR